MTANLRASLLMSASMAGFTVNDALVKSLSGEIGTGQVMLVRGFFIVVFIGLYVRIAKVPVAVSTLKSAPMALRVFSEAFATVFFLTALFRMPIANVSAILQALPLAVTLGAALFLGEPVGIRRISAIAIGFVGVLFVVRPGLEGFNISSVFVLVTVIFAATRDLATRRLPARIPSITVSFYTAIAVTACGAAWMQNTGGWQPMSARSLGVLAIAAVSLFIGYQCIVLAMRSGDIHVVAPFRYTSLLWAIVLGIAAFGEVPDALTLVGAAIIVATGLYTLYRERAVARKSAAANMSAASAPPARGT